MKVYYALFVEPAGLPPRESMSVERQDTNVAEMNTSGAPDGIVAKLKDGQILFVPMSNVRFAKVDLPGDVEDEGPLLPTRARPGRPRKAADA